MMQNEVETEILPWFIWIRGSPIRGPSSVIPMMKNIAFWAMLGSIVESPICGDYHITTDNARIAATISIVLLLAGNLLQQTSNNDRKSQQVPCDSLNPDPQTPNPK